MFEKIINASPLIVIILLGARSIFRDIVELEIYSLSLKSTQKSVDELKKLRDKFQTKKWKILFLIFGNQNYPKKLRQVRRNIGYISVEKILKDLE